MKRGPFLQGARLTTWELQRDNIPVSLITDNMAGYFMREGKIDLIIVGADRIAANGDTANKIGTYSLAVLAKEHGLPFYVAAPLSTIDRTLETGDAIPIEQRHGDEVRLVRQPARCRTGGGRSQPRFRRDACRVYPRHHHGGRCRHASRPGKGCIPVRKENAP